MGEARPWSFNVPADIDDDVRGLLGNGSDQQLTLADYVLDLIQQDLLLRSMAGTLRRGNAMTDDDAMTLATREVAAYRREKALGIHKNAA